MTKKNDFKIEEYKYDFSHLKKRVLPNTIGAEMLVKASKPKAIYQKLGMEYDVSKIAEKVEIDKLPLAVDATAGLGEDSFILAAAGFRVIMYERDNQIADLLEKTLDDARRSGDEIIQNISERMTLVKDDSIIELPQMCEIPEVVLLDPMFPERKKSGLVKKKFQMIHTMEKPCEDEKELFDAARKTNACKIMVKRPAKGPFLADEKPSYSIYGNVIRYDVYI